MLFSFRMKCFSLIKIQKRRMLGQVYIGQPLENEAEQGSRSKLTGRELGGQGSCGGKKVIVIGNN